MPKHLVLGLAAIALFTIACLAVIAATTQAPPPPRRTRPVPAAEPELEATIPPAPPPAPVAATPAPPAPRPAVAPAQPAPRPAASPAQTVEPDHEDADDLALDADRGGASPADEEGEPALRPGAGPLRDVIERRRRLALPGAPSGAEAVPRSPSAPAQPDR